jgi:hypothetical protein
MARMGDAMRIIGRTFGGRHASARICVQFIRRLTAVFFAAVLVAAPSTE